MRDSAYHPSNERICLSLVERQGMLMSAEGMGKVYVDIRELSALTGRSVTSLRRDVQKGRIQAFQPAGAGGKLLFRPDAIENCADDRASSQPSGSRSSQLAGRRPKWMAQSNVVEHPNPQ